MFSAKLRILTCFVFFLAINAEDADLYRTVETKNGQIRGIRLKTLLQNMDYFAFRGIPYAEKPIGELRFKAPKPVESWKPNTLDALDYGDACIQRRNFFVIPNQQSEDCLFLNIFVPDDIGVNEKLAVMFYIHGGGYNEGSGDDYYFGPDFLIERRVILVTLNYRLGPFGFLSLDSKEYSGNMGLKDQQLALKWVHTNINNFGGDNKRITVFGHSAGGASSHFHILSPESRKYYRNAIPMSGTTETCWATAKENNHLKLMFEIAKEMGEPKQTYEELVDFIKTISGEKISKRFPSYDRDHTVKLIWAPVVERSDAIRPFITEKPIQIYEKFNINIDSMFGITSHESLMFVPAFDASILSNFIESDFNLTLPFKNVEIPFESEEYRSLAKEIREFYINNHPGGTGIDRYVALSSDVNFAYSINKVARLQATKSSGKTFYYMFEVDSLLNDIKYAKQIDRPGTSHGDELCYLFHCRSMKPRYEQILSNRDSDESKIALKAIDNLTKLFSNFAKYGTPTHNNEPIAELRPIEEDVINFVHLTNDGLKTAVNPNEKSDKFWGYIEQKARKLMERQNEIEHEEL